MNRHFRTPLASALFALVITASPLTARQANVVVYSSVTPAGKEVGRASAEQPQYYVLINRGYQTAGPAHRDLRPPESDLVERQVRKALAQRHYLPAPDDGSRVDLCIVLHWGALYKESVPGGDFINFTQQNASGREEFGRVGDPFSEMILNEAEFNSLLTGGTLDDMHPWDFNRRDLAHQMRKNRYLIIVQAYAAEDFHSNQAMARKLWQTQMSVDQSRTNLTDSIPSLLVAGRDYFGESSRFGRIKRTPIGDHARVEIGDIDVVREPSVRDPNETH